MFNMQLTYDAPTNSGTAQYNGNIATMEWKTNINGLCGERQLYKFSYDGSNRLTAADHRRWNGSAWVDPAKYNESGITYDLNGNIKTYVRQGLISGTTYGTIDNLTYTYGDALRPDRLTQMADAGNSTKGFKYVPLSALYQYDLNGNMTQDNHKGFVIAYNHLNLPITFTKGTSVITITYAADGTKLSKAVTGGGAIKNYVSGIEYSGANVEAIYHVEGRCTPNGTTFYYEYTIKDHLGNARVNFRANGTAATHLEEMHYYPFGMLIEGLGTVSPINDYSYNGKELNDDFGLNLSDYGARWYDAAVGRWWGVDPLAEKYGGWSTYNYCMNNPIVFIDPDGMQIIISYRENKKSTPISVEYNSEGKLINRADGKEYTGDNKYILSVKEALDGLKMMDDKTNKVIEDLVDGNENHAIQNYDPVRDGTKTESSESYNVKSRDSENPKGSLTKFVPDKDRKRLKNKTLSNEEILGHELKHAYNRKNGLYDLGMVESDGKRVPKEEIDGINFQNIVRDRQGQMPRTKFAGIDISKFLIKPSDYNNFK